MIASLFGDSTVKTMKLVPSENHPLSGIITRLLNTHTHPPSPPEELSNLYLARLIVQVSHKQSGAGLASGVLGRILQWDWAARRRLHMW